MLVFEERVKPEYPELNDENQKQTQQTYDADSGNRTWATLVGGECSHECAIPVPSIVVQKLDDAKVGGPSCPKQDEANPRLVCTSASINNQSTKIARAPKDFGKLGNVALVGQLEQPAAQKRDIHVIE